MIALIAMQVCVISDIRESFIYSGQGNQLQIGNPKCRLHDEYFDGKSEMDYKRLESILLELVNQEGKEADFVRLLIVYLFTPCFCSHYGVGKLYLGSCRPGEFSKICLGWCKRKFGGP